MSTRWHYAKEREVFGTPIAQKQSIAFGLAEMAIEIEAIRLLVWEAAWLLDAGKDAAVSRLSGADRGVGPGDDGHRPRRPVPRRARLHP